MHKNNKSFSLAVFVLLAGCGMKSTESNTQDIANPGNLDSENTLLWTADNAMHLGICPAGSVPTRQRCPSQARRALADVTTQLQTALQTEVAAATTLRDNEISALKERHPEIIKVRADLAALNQQMTQNETEVRNLTAEIATLTADIAIRDANIADYNTQIAELTRRIQATPANTELVLLKARFETERHQEVQEKAVKETRKAEATIEKQASETVLTQLRPVKAEYERILQVKLGQIQVDSTTLQTHLQTIANLQAEQAQSAAVVAKISDNGISYRGDLLDAASKRVIARLHLLVRSGSAVRVTGTNNILEVFYNNEWRGVCDDSFDTADAQVACRSMGKTLVRYVGDVTTSSSAFWLDDLQCRGTESSLMECSASPVGSHDCSASEHVTLECR